MKEDRPWKSSYATNYSGYDSSKSDEILKEVKKFNEANLKLVKLLKFKPIKIVIPNLISKPSDWNEKTAELKKLQKIYYKKENSNNLCGEAHEIHK